jgi:VCBS repeat protein
VSGFLIRRLVVALVAVGAFWGAQVGTSWAFDQARYPFENVVAYPSIGLGDLQATDLNGDGHLDLIGWSSGALKVAMGDGTGAFADPQTIAPQISQYVLGDANGDGLPDIAVQRPDGSGGSEIAVFVNDGDGLSFTNTEVLPVGTTTKLWGMAQFGSGPNDDLLTVDEHILTPSNPTTVISVLPGAGDGTFGDAIASPVDSGPILSGEARTLNYVASADLDGDGIRDAVIGTTLYSQGSTSLVMKGLSDGHFEAAVQHDLYGPNGIAIGDINGDGRPDLVGLDHGATGQNPWYVTNLGGLGFSPQQPLAGTPPYTWPVMGLPTIADFDGDGFGDVVGPTDRNQPIGISYGNEDGVLPPIEGNPVGPTNPPRYGGSASGDFNEDGLPDVAVGGSSLGILLHKPAPDDTPPPDGGGVLGDVSTSGTGLHVLKHHFPKSVKQLLRKGVTATVSCDVACELTARLVAHDGSVKAFHLPDAGFARAKTTVAAGRIVKVRVKPTGGMAALLATGGASGKSLGYGLRLTSTPAS